MNDDELLTLKEVAQQVKLDEKTIRRYIKSGQLAAVFVGGKYRVSRADLDDFLRRRRTNQGQQANEDIKN